MLKYICRFKIKIIILLSISSLLSSFKHLSKHEMEKLDRKVFKARRQGASFIVGRLPIDFSEEKNKKQRARSYEIADYIIKNRNISKNSKNKTIYESDKISLKLIFYTDKKGRILMKELMSFLKYAKERNIFVYIDSKYREDKNLEIQTYLELFKKTDNIGITLATYHNTIDKSVDKVLARGGHIRLVKGYYNDYSVKDWEVVGKNYIRNAIKLIKSGNFHTLATHDFEILDIIFKDYSGKMKNIELMFFWFARKHVYENLETFKYKDKIAMKCFYYPLGNPLGSVEVLKKIDFHRMLQRRLERKVS